MAAASPGTATTGTATKDGEVFAFVPPVPVATHHFKRLGSLHFSSTPYTASPLADTLHRTSALLVVSNRYSRVFLVSSTSPSALLVASTSDVIAAVQRAAGEADEYDDDSKQASFAATAFVSVPLSDSDGLWHLSLSSDEQWLLSIADERGSLYHISQFAHLQPNAPLDPLLTFDHPDVIVSVQWSPHHASLLYLLSSDGQLSVQQVSEAGVDEVGLFNNRKTAITAFLLSSYPDNELIYLAHADGSLDVSTLDIDPHKLSQHGYAVRDEDDEDETKDMQMRFQRRYKGRIPCPRDFTRQPAVHHISQPDPHTLILGYALSKCGDVQSSDFLRDEDVARVAVCSFNLDNAEEYYWGDVLEDELRLSAEDKPYTARHRYSLLPLPALATALLWSNRAAETVIVGPDPSGDPSRWVPYAVPAEDDKAIVPFDADFNDTYALGASFDVANSVQVACNEHEQAAMPLLVMLTSDATVHLYHFVCTQPSVAEVSQRVMVRSVEAIPAVVSFPDGPSSLDRESVPSFHSATKSSPLVISLSASSATSSAAVDSHVSSPAAESLSSTASSESSTRSTDTTAAVTPVSSSLAPPAYVPSSSASGFVPIIVLAPSSPSAARRDHSPPLTNGSPSSVMQSTARSEATVADESRSLSPDAIVFHYVQSTNGSIQQNVSAADMSTTTTTASTSVDSGAILISEPYFDASATGAPATSPSIAAVPVAFVDSSLVPSEAVEHPSNEVSDLSIVSDMTVSPPATVDPSVSESAPSMLAAVDPSSNKPDEMVAPAADVFSSPALSIVVSTATWPSTISTAAQPVALSPTSSDAAATSHTLPLGDDQHEVAVVEPSGETVEAMEVMSHDPVIARVSDGRVAAPPSPSALPHSDLPTEPTGTDQRAVLSVSQLTAQFVSLTSEFLQRQEQLAASREQLHALEQSTLALHSHHSVLHSLNSQIASLTQQLSEQQGRADSLDGRIDQQSAHLIELCAALETSERQRLALQAAAMVDAESHADVVRQLQAQLAAAKAAAVAIPPSSSQSDMAVSQLQAELAAVRAELAQTRQQLATTIPPSQHQHELSTANSQLSTTQNALTAAQANAATLRQQLSESATASKAATSLNGFPFESKEFRSALEAFSAHEHNLNTLRQQLHASHALASNPLTTTTTAATTATGTQQSQPAQLSLQQADQVTRHLLLSSQLAIVGQECLASLEKVRREVELLVRHEEARSQRLRHAQKALTKGRPLDASSYSVSDQCSIS